MNKTATVEKMQSMRLHGMSRAYRETYEIGAHNGLTPDEMISFLIDAEWDERYNRRLARLLKKAGFRYRCRLEEIECGAQRCIDKNMIQRFADVDWIRNAENIIITGATGSGKSFLSNAIGNQACVNGYTVLYYNCMKFFSKMKMAKADGTYIKEIKKIRSAPLLILDDFGISPLDKDTRLILLEVLEDRIGLASTIVATQLPVEHWYDTIGDSTIADAIIDRLVNSSHKICIKGESMRKKFWKIPAT